MHEVSHPIGINMKGELHFDMEEFSTRGLDVYDCDPTFECIFPINPFLFLCLYKWSHDNYYIPFTSNSYLLEPVLQTIRSSENPTNENYYLTYKDYASQFAGVSQNYPQVCNPNPNL
jgi:hypothetical protein